MAANSQLIAWIGTLDLNDGDLAYLHSMLTDSFADWLTEAESFPWLEGALILVHPDGSVLAERESENNAVALPKDWDTASTGQSAVSVALASGRPAGMRADKHCTALLAAYDTAAVPIFTRRTDVLCAVIACLAPAGAAGEQTLKLLQAAALHYRSVLYRRFEQLFLDGILRDYGQAGKEEKRRDILFDMMSKLNDHIGAEDVFLQVLDSLERLYPDSRADLFLSQDFNSKSEKIKPLAFHHDAMDTCRAAYIDGQIHEEWKDGRLQLAIPLSGKQGIYGVLRLDAVNNAFDRLDVQFLEMLGKAAGIAFEKAKLHEQSNLLVSELRLINELTARLNKSLKLADTMNFATAELMRIFAADYCCFLQYNELTKEFEVLTTNVPELSERIFPRDNGVCGVMWKSKEPIILSDYSSMTPVKSRLMDATGSRSLLASPLLLNGELIGAVMLSKKEPNHFSYENYKMLQVLASNLGLALANSSLHAEVRRMVITDRLTGLYARHYLDENIGRRQMRDSCGTLMLVDIDNFKLINDTYGHQIGDRILIQVSNIIRSAIRDDDIAARWGGEEIAIYFPMLGREQGVMVADRIRKRVELETDPQVTVSCGISGWEREDEKISVESLFFRADMALYDAKNGGRNRIETRK